MTTRIKARGIDFTVEDRGAGPVLLLVHGFPLNHAMWSPQIEAMSKPYRVIAPDLRGFGQSGGAAGTVSMADYADDLAAILEAMNVSEPLVLVGFSMGGYISFAFWRKYLARLRGLALVDTRATPDSPEAAADRRELADRVLVEGSGPVASAMLGKLFAPATQQRRPDLVAMIREMMASSPPAGVAAALRGLAARPDVTALLPEIRVPTLVVVGAEDVISTPAEMRHLADVLPDARFVQIPDAGHMAPIENPKAVNEQLLSFCRELHG